MKMPYKKSLLASILILSLSGCVSGELAALCAATVKDRDLTAAVVAQQGTDDVVIVVQPLISKIDAACD